MAVLKELYKKYSSMKTGLVLLVSIGLISALGSGFFPESFPHTVLFRVLILLLFINMVLCTTNQINRFFKVLNKNRNKTWFRQLGTLLLHAGIIIILLGGSINSFYGNTARIIIAEGDTVPVYKFIGSQHPFDLKLDKFEIRFNTDGSPAQYYSKVRTISGNKCTGKASISVNHPLKYEGVKLYQESFGNLVATEAQYKGKTIKMTLGEGEFIEPPGTSRTVKMFKYIPNFDPEHGMETKTLRPDNPRVIFSVYQNKKLLGIGAAKLGEPVEIDQGSIIKFTAVKPYTVLTAKTDPGLPFAGIGGIMLMGGVCLALFISPPRKKTNAEIEKDEDVSADDIL